LAVVGFFVQLMSGAFLLLFAVRFMRVGLERIWGAAIKRSLSQTSSTLSHLGKGIFLGFGMQGATVVMLLAAGLASSNTIPIISAVLLAIGADFGSAIAVLFFTLPISSLGPLAILVGVWFYHNSDSEIRKSAGRVILGFGLIFLSLSLIRGAVEPLKEFPDAASVVGYLNTDPLTAAIVGMVLAFLMHSSLAAILTALAFAANGSLDIMGGLGFVLGCNTGSALLPIWLMRSETDRGPIVAKTVAVLRVGLATILVLAISEGEIIIGFVASLRAEQVMLGGHVLFNFMLLLLAPLSNKVLTLFKDESASSSTDLFFISKSETDMDVIIARFKTQGNRMIELLKQMFDTVTQNAPDQVSIYECESKMNLALSDLRKAYVGLPILPNEVQLSVQMTLDMAINLESCADILSGKYTSLRIEELSGNYVLSTEGREEIIQLCEEVRKGLHLAQSVYWSGNPDIARRLVEQKQHIAKLEANSRSKHFQRNSAGNITSLSSSNPHLEIISALKSVTGKISIIGYTVLDQHGGLKKSRLKNVS
jgi:phosphate:Na+ symporter